ncbi:MAG: hypothetical protein K6360_04330 [Deltaproteobacteria bacterium]
MRRRAIPILFLGVLLLCIAGCDPDSKRYRNPKPPGSEALSMDPVLDVPPKVQRSFVEYWSARVRRDWPVVYRFEAPHVKYQITEEDFSRYLGNGKPLGKVLVKGVEKKGDATWDLSLELEFKETGIKGINDIKIPLQDRWIMINGNCYHVFKDFFLRIS